MTFCQFLPTASSTLHILYLPSKTEPSSSASVYAFLVKNPLCHYPFVRKHKSMYVYIVSIQHFRSLSFRLFFDILRTSTPKQVFVVFTHSSRQIYPEAKVPPEHLIQDETWDHRSGVGSA
uniref:Uncharacterized protein n=1 Tax=Opuntia streptacantha TaxID=393608 RepID=A0A7C9DC96_OPUST